MAIGWLLAGLLQLCCVSAAFAHPEGFSGMHVTVMPGRMQAALTLHTRDLGDWFPPGKYPDYVADVCRELEKSAGEVVELQIDEQPLRPVKVKAFLLEVGLIEVDVDYDFSPSNETVELLVWSKHLIHMPRGHRQLLFIEDRRETPADGERGLIRLEDVLTVERDAGFTAVPPAKGSAVKPPAQTNGPPAQRVGSKESSAEVKESAPVVRKPKTAPVSGQPSSRISFFLFGVEHIITGYDHLLFLAALLLTCTKFKEAAVIITCFTVAHSITLALAALDVVRLPGEIVEPVIALSIVYVAIENLFGTPALWRRAAVTCLFGLVHGLGFASALRDIGLGTIPGGVLWPLLEFNLGVEAGQLGVAVVFLPLLWLTRRNEQLVARLVPAGSISVAVVGGYWLVTRVMSQFVAG